MAKPNKTEFVSEQCFLTPAAMACDYELWHKDEAKTEQYARQAGSNLYLAGKSLEYIHHRQPLLRRANLAWNYLVDGYYEEKQSAE